MNIYFIIAPTRGHLADLGPIPEDLYVFLDSRGHRVRIGFNEDQVLPLEKIRNEYELYVLKGHDELSLSLAKVLTERGAFVLEPYASCAASENKIVATCRLQAAGVPVPNSWIATNLSDLKDLVRRHPIMLKPHIGGMGRSELIKLLRTEHDVPSELPRSFVYYVQEFIPGPGIDLKVYVIDDYIFALRKPFSPRAFYNQVEPRPVTCDIRRIVERCAAASGLKLFGLDIIESKDGPVVVDLNYFPSYYGVPDAGRLIGEYIEKRVSQRRPATSSAR